MLNFQIPPPRRLCHSSFPDGSPRQGYLSGEATLGGLTFVCEIAFYENTRVRVGRLAQSQKIRGAFWSSFVYFSPEGKLASGKPVEDVSLKGFHFQAGQYIDFDPKGNPLGGFSATTQVLRQEGNPGAAGKVSGGGTGARDRGGPAAILAHRTERIGLRVCPVLAGVQLRQLFRGRQVRGVGDLHHPPGIFTGGTPGFCKGVLPRGVPRDHRVGPEAPRSGLWPPALSL